ncbi:MAG: hypothetical protein HFJ30_00110 [Clostridia bacterium]|nr:hypothetical protein [Clostridia bacterium]
MQKTIKNGINLIIQELEKIRDSENIADFRINMQSKPYYTEDHTKGAIVKSKLNGNKITITITQGTTISLKHTYLGTEIIEED